MTGDIVAMLVGVTMALVLAVRGFRSQDVSFGKTAMMAVAWAIIIAVVAFAFYRFGA